MTVGGRRSPPCAGARRRERPRDRELDKDYEYSGLIAEGWDLLRGDTAVWPDRPFYRRIVELGGGAALDVGCGTGRLLLDYLAAGLDVDGADNSPEMLALCRDKAAARGLEVEGRLFELAMDELALPRRYATILVPSSTFQLLTDRSAASRALDRFFDHLVPGGVLVMSIMSKLWRGRTAPAQMAWTDWRVIGEAARPDGETSLRRWFRARYDHAAQLEHEENRYEVLRGETVIRREEHARSPAVRWYSQGEAAALCEAAGFAAVTVTSGFTFEKASETDTIFCVMGKRP